MSAQDATFLHVENDVTPMHIGGVSIFEGPPPPFRELRAMVESKLPLTPRYRQKVRFVPLGMGEPVWIDDPHFNIDYHLRHSAVPSPGTEKQLRATAARVFSQHLDRSKPLWEIWMLEGLEDEGWALLSKVHHCMVDGVAATDMMSLMFGESPKPTNGEVWQPEPEPSGLDLITYSARHRVRDPAAQIRFALRAPTEALRGFAGAARAMAAAVPAMRPATSSLTGPIGPHRVWSWAKVPLAGVKEIRAGLGGTVNDVVLTLITNGYRELLEGRGEPISGDTAIRTMVPVSVRSPGERGEYNNRVSAVFARLPVGIDDPAERLGAIREQMDGIKSSKQAVAGDALAQLSGFAPPMLLALGSRVATRSARLNMDTATTNVPGPQHAMHTLDRTLLASYPYVPIVGTIRIVVAIFSYDGQLYFGVTGDRDHAPDVDVLTRGIEADVERLLDRAQLAPA